LFIPSTYFSSLSARCGFAVSMCLAIDLDVVFGVGGEWGGVIAAEENSSSLGRPLSKANAEYSGGSSIAKFPPLTQPAKRGTGKSGS
jgi:hypothetical protein